MRKKSESSGCFIPLPQHRITEKRTKCKPLCLKINFGPLYLSIYINDIDLHISTYTKLRCVASDILLYKEIKPIQNCQILQKDTDTLQGWEK